MKLKEYIEQLNDLIVHNPEYAELPLAYASDDEGNSYHRVSNPPIAAYFEDSDSYYLDGAWFDEYPDDPNFIVIN